MKLIKMLPLLLGMLFAAGSFTSVAVADTSVIAAAGGAASHMPADPKRQMRDEYHYKDTNDTYGLQFAIIGIGIAIFFTVVSIAGGFGKNKS